MYALRFLVAMMAVGALARAETWQTKDGPVSGTLTSVFGPMAILTDGDRLSKVPLDAFSDDDLNRVAIFLERQPAAAAPWKDSTSKVAKALRGKLDVLQAGRLVKLDPGARPEPELYVVYFGAFWCPPCRRFSPTFVVQYQRLQKLAPGRFEAVFISSDRSQDEQEAYVKEVNMPWPVLRYARLGSVDVLEKWAGRGIPCLAIVTRDGQVLAHSYNGEEYLGTEPVLRTLESLLRAESSEQAKRMRHRLAVIQHVRQAKGGPAPARPYLITLDPQRYQTLTTDALTAHLEIDDHGQVTKASFEPKQNAAVDYDLVQDAERWLFLPTVREGRAMSAKADLPISVPQVAARKGAVSGGRVVPSDR